MQLRTSPRIGKLPTQVDPSVLTALTSGTKHVKHFGNYYVCGDTRQPRPGEYVVTASFVPLTDGEIDRKREQHVSYTEFLRGGYVNVPEVTVGDLIEPTTIGTLFFVAADGLPLTDLLNIALNYQQEDDTRNTANWAVVFVVTRVSLRVVP